MSAHNAPITVKCPHCKRPVAWTADYPFKPFCCKRCKLIDLGEWVAEAKKIPGDPITLDDDPYPDDTLLH